MTITFYERVGSSVFPGAPSLVPANHKVFQFPGGESHVVLEPKATVQIAFVQGAEGDDLMALAMWADACKRHGGLKTVLALPYLPGARQDRGTPLGAKVYADFINSLGIDHVVCIDPHSDVAPALYDRLTIVPLTDLPIWDTLFKGKFAGVIIPDVGAAKRAQAVADKLGVPTYQAGKKRDFATGKLSGFHCEQLPPNGHFLVVDDICDGGGTFVGLADAIAEQDKSDFRLSLWVTHGIYSKGMSALEFRYSNIYNTNSHPGYSNNPNRTGANILPTLINHVKGI